MTTTAAYRLFVEKLQEGYGWQVLAGLFFRLHGFDVEIPELRIAPPDTWEGWTDQGDLRVEGQPVEVKTSSYPFGERHAFAEPIIDAVRVYQAKEEKPIAYVIISMPTGAMLWLPGRKGQEDWRKCVIFDRSRGIEDEFYVVPRERLRTIDSLVEGLRALTREHSS